MFSNLSDGLRTQAIVPCAFLVACRQHRLQAACQQRPVLGAETSRRLCNSSQPLCKLCLLAAWRPAGSTGGGCSCRLRSRGNRSSTPQTCVAGRTRATSNRQGSKCCCPQLCLDLCMHPLYRCGQAGTRKGQPPSEGMCLMECFACSGYEAQAWLVHVCPPECMTAASLMSLVLQCRLVPLCLTMWRPQLRPPSVQARIEVMIAGDMSNHAQTLEKRNAELQVRLVALL